MKSWKQAFESEKAKTKRELAEIGIPYSFNEDILRASPTKKQLEAQKKSQERILRRQGRANFISLFKKRPQQNITLKGHKIINENSDREELEKELERLKGGNE